MKIKSILIQMGLVSITILGCTDTSVTPEPTINVTTTESLLGSKKNSSAKAQAVQYYSDWSGQIEVIVLDGSFGNNQQNFGAIALPSDYVLIGGGGLYNQYRN